MVLVVLAYSVKQVVTVLLCRRNRASWAVFDSCLGCCQVPHNWLISLMQPHLCHSIFRWSSVLNLTWTPSTWIYPLVDTCCLLSSRFVYVWHWWNCVFSGDVLSRSVDSAAIDHVLTIGLKYPDQWLLWSGFEYNRVLCRFVKSIGPVIVFRSVCQIWLELFCVAERNPTRWCHS